MINDNSIIMHIMNKCNIYNTITRKCKKFVYQHATEAGFNGVV